MTVTSQWEETLQTGLREMGINGTRDQTNQFLRYMNLLIEWNQKMNLTAITDPKAILTHHFLDSLTCAAHGSFSKTDQLVDVGTGAGFPGIPLAIAYPEKRFTLMDSLSKRIGFLEKVKSELELANVKMVHCRAEEAGQTSQFREMFDAAVSRAVAPLPVLLEYVIPLIRPGGWFYCQKGTRWEKEMHSAKNACADLFVELEEAIPAQVPLTDLHHQLLVFRKTRSTDPQYPRRPGVPSKKPL